MIEYLRLADHIIKHGELREDRTGVGTLGIFGASMRFNLSSTFPLLTTKKMFLRGIICELIWFLKGDTNIKYLNDNGVHIWDEWADADGNIGPAYGHQWVKWEGTHRTYYNQIANVIDSIKNDPYSRRHIVSAWNVADVDDMALPPCHCLFQFYVSDGSLSCLLYQRSADVFLGLPFNIASYALLTMMIAQVCRLKPGELIHTIGDAHIYTNHIEQIKEQLNRDPLPLPTMKINPKVDDIFGFTLEDFTLRHYQSHPAIRGEIAI